MNKFNEERCQLQTEVQQLQKKLETFKSSVRGSSGSMANGPLNNSFDDYETQSKENNYSKLVIIISFGNN